MTALNRLEQCITYLENKLWFDEIFIDQPIEIANLMPEFHQLLKLGEKITANELDYSITKEVKQTDQKKFVDLLTNLLGKIDKIKNPPTLLVRSTNYLHQLKHVLVHKAIIDNIKNLKNPEIMTFSHELDQLIRTEDNIAEYEILEWMELELEKQDIKKRFFDILKTVVGKLEQLNNPPESVAKYTSNLQLLMLTQASFKVMAIMRNFMSSLDTISAKSDEIKEVDDFINQFVKYSSTHVLEAEIISQDQFKKLKKVHQMLTPIGQINDIFNTLSTKIETIEQAPSLTTYEEAINLQSKLHAARQAFYDKLPADNQAALNTLANKFIQDCTEAINGSKQFLENERSWGEFLVDFLDSLVNAVVKVVTLGFGSTNFSFYSTLNKNARTTLDEALADLSKSKLG